MIKQPATHYFIFTILINALRSESSFSKVEDCISFSAISTCSPCLLYKFLNCIWCSQLIMRAMSGQSTPRPKALVAIISHKIVCVLQKSVKTISCISGVVAAVNMLIKRNSTMFGNPGGSVMFSPTGSLICRMFHHILVVYGETKLLLEIFHTELTVHLLSLYNFQLVKFWHPKYI